MNPILYCLSGAPSLRATETIEMALVSAVFDQPTAVVFIDDGVFQLVSNIERSLFKDTRKMILGFPTYEINHVYVVRNSLKERHLLPAQIPEFVKPLAPEDMAELFVTYPLVIHD